MPAGSDRSDAGWAAEPTLLEARDPAGLTPQWLPGLVLLLPKVESRDPGKKL